MKHTRIATILTTVTAAVCLLPAAGAFAEDAATITLRVEGVHGNLYYETVAITAGETLQAALLDADQKSDALTITGVESGYITEVNGEAAGAFGGWDGWLYRVNDMEPTVGVDGFQLSDGDSVVLYYSDAYGAGMQYPVADCSRLADGVLRFTSTDVTYDADYKPQTSVNPVADATVTWTYAGGTASYKTDGNGCILLDPAQMAPGKHGMQISKATDAGLPLVLRFAPDYAVNVTAAPVQTTTQTTTTVVTTTTTTITTTAAPTTTAETTPSPNTGDVSAVLPLLLLVSGAGAVCLRRREK